MAALSSNSPYFPSLQIQSQPQLPCIAMDHDDDDDDLLNLAAAASTSGYSFNFDSMLLDPTPFLDTNYEHQQQQQQFNCFSQFPECYCYLPFHVHNHHSEQLLQLPSFHDQGGDIMNPCSNFIHYHDQQLHPLKALNSSFNLEPEAAAAAVTVTAQAPLAIRKSSVNNNDGERKRVTAQSMAARERRRKITKKTQELGKLVPGGSKMNTAEMLQSAFKYIKFLQSQLQLLQLISSFPGLPPIQGNEEEKVPPLHVVAWPLVQEKLYMEGRCIIPLAFAKTLIQNTTDPSISEELRELID